MRKRAARQDKKGSCVRGCDSHMWPGSGSWAGWSSICGLFIVFFVFLFLCIAFIFYNYLHLAYHGSHQPQPSRFSTWVDWEPLFPRFPDSLQPKFLDFPEPVDPDFLWLWANLHQDGGSDSVFWRRPWWVGGGVVPQKLNSHVFSTDYNWASISRKIYVQHLRTSEKSHLRYIKKIATFSISSRGSGSGRAYCCC